MEKDYSFKSEQVFANASESTEPIPRGAVLFLTNNDNTTPLFEWVRRREPLAVRHVGKLDVKTAAEARPRFAMSFNYRHIIPSDAIVALGCPVANVHCSLLPWNRGASPNFFSYYENTPKGVTVHELTEGLDKGGVLLQRELPLTEEESFESSYCKLIEAAFDLITSSWERLRDGRIAPRRQAGGGSYHTSAEFSRLRERYPFEWDDRVVDWKQRNGLD